MQEQECVSETVSDHFLLRRFKDGNQDAAAEIYLRYAKRLNGLVKKSCSKELSLCVDFEDIVQSVFGSFFRGLAGGHYDLPNGEEFWKLLLVIALHKIRDKADYFHAAKRDSRHTINGNKALTQQATMEAADDSGFAFLHLALDEAMGCITSEAQKMVKLRVEGYEVEEISSKTGRSRRTVERMLHNARLELGRHLRDE